MRDPEPRTRCGLRARWTWRWSGRPRVPRSRLNGSAGGGAQPSRYLDRGLRALRAARGLFTFSFTVPASRLGLPVPRSHTPSTTVRTRAPPLGGSISRARSVPRHTRHSTLHSQIHARTARVRGGGSQPISLTRSQSDPYGLRTRSARTRNIAAGLSTEGRVGRGRVDLACHQPWPPKSAARRAPLAAPRSLTPAHTPSVSHVMQPEPTPGGELPTAPIPAPKLSMFNCGQSRSVAS